MLCFFEICHYVNYVNDIGYFIVVLQPNVVVFLIDSYKTYIYTTPYHTGRLYKLL